MSPPTSVHVVVIAGGSGTRFWPLSRQAYPKQLLNLSGSDTLLHATFQRVASWIPPPRWWMVVGASHADGCQQVMGEMAASQILVEPLSRNTAPAIGLAAVHIRHLSHGEPQPVMVVLPADHHVQHPQTFCQALHKAVALASQGPMVTLGIQPTYPETGYGYIQQGAADERVEGTFGVKRFCEKPDLERARLFVAQGDFVWNAGIFVMQPQVYLAELKRQLPLLYDALVELEDAIGQPFYESRLKAAYDRIMSISIDYGVMEHGQEVAVVPVDCGWSDVGSWGALGALASADAHGNILLGRAVVLDSQDCVAYATEGHVVGMLGLEGVVVVHTPDATLAIPKARAQEVRSIVERMGEHRWDEFL